VGRAQAAVALDQRDRLGQLRVRAGAASEDELAAGGLLSARTICGLSHVLVHKRDPMAPHGRNSLTETLIEVGASLVVSVNSMGAEGVLRAAQ